MPILFDIADRAAVHLGIAGREADRIFKKADLSPDTTLSAFEPDEAPPEILFPPIGAELWAGNIEGAPARAFVLAGRGSGELTWYVDGAPCALDDGGLPAWTPEHAGFYTISLVDQAGRQTNRRIRVLR